MAAEGVVEEVMVDIMDLEGMLATMAVVLVIVVEDTFNNEKFSLVNAIE